nr:cytochrome b6f complex subunit 6 [Analipus japonicus]WAM61906.1 cytochrome b6f complex subunit 6 [Analipus japonicus]
MSVLFDYFLLLGIAFVLASGLFLGFKGIKLI